MRELQAQTVLLVRAFEEADHGGRLLPPLRRAEATRLSLELAEPLAAQEGPLVVADVRRAEAVQARAGLLLEALTERYPLLPRLTRVTRWSGGVVGAVCCAAFLAGLFSNALGAARKINLLAFPLLGLLAWNLLVYLWIFVGRGWTRRAARRAGATAAASGPLVRVVVRMALRVFPRRLGSRSGADTEILGRALSAFAARWGRLAAPLLSARVRRTLHLAALAAVAGVVGGIYVQGLAFEYRVTWESTLLDARHVDTLLRVALGPAAFLVGLPVPDAAPLRAPGSGEAAVWIHLYALTALLFVGLPRSVLAAVESVRIFRLASRMEVDLDDGYFRRLFAPWSGAGLRLDILPYSYRPAAGEREALKRLLHEAFGARAHVEFRRPLDYGASGADALRETCASARQEAECCIVVLFGLAQTPENEVHGAFLREITECLSGRPPRLLVLVDVSRYRGRVQRADRWRERFDAWRRAVEAVGLEPVEIDLAFPDGVVQTGDGGAAGTLNALASAIWSGEPG